MLLYTDSMSEGRRAHFDRESIAAKSNKLLT
jgi:hypothetical protein